jgi:hypothetical protein
MNIENSSIAAANLKKLFQNPYPGRGIVVGQDELGNVVQVYWLMGRSAGSRNRILVASGNRVSTKLANPAFGGGDTNLTIYNAMDHACHQHIVSNGSQTDSITESAKDRQNFDTFRQALAKFQHEPDAPNFTPRISAICTTGLYRTPRFYISMIRKSGGDAMSDRFFYNYDSIPAGFGRMITTYSGDGNPLPSFTGEPELVPVQGDINEIQDAFWYALNEDNRISLVVKIIDPKTGAVHIQIRNKYALAANVS